MLLSKYSKVRQITASIINRQRQNWTPQQTRNYSKSCFLLKMETDPENPDRNEVKPDKKLSSSQQEELPTHLSTSDVRPEKYKKHFSKLKSSQGETFSLSGQIDEIANKDAAYDQKSDPELDDLLDYSGKQPEMSRDNSGHASNRKRDESD